MWQHLFGSGLVETENDFGYQGALPSHPELLDFLAIELMDGGWQMKRLYKLIAMSATYRQSSNYRADVADRDPKNRWLARQNRFRVEGEIVRDVALATSGLLSRKVGGRSVFPPIPANVIGTSSANHRWPTSKGPDRYRRGVYTAVYRANVYPMLLAFDGPDRDNACTKRTLSNTPLQALTIANDEVFVEMAREFGKRIHAHQNPANDQTQRNRSRVNFAYKVALSREPTTLERSRILEFQRGRRTYYESNPSEAESIAKQPSPELASWIAVARTVINLDEFITRE